MAEKPGAAFRIPKMMWAVMTTGNGGYDKLNYTQVPVPTIKDGEALVKVLAAGVNNTEINTRLGWYSKNVDESTSDCAVEQEEDASHKEYGGWNEATPFPFIQGTDCCGRVVAVGSTGEELIGSRVLIRCCIRGPQGFASMDNIWMASDFDGAFAQFVKVPVTEIFPVNCTWNDVELGSIPCAYGTAENMVHRCGIKEGDVVFVPGGSGGVGSAVIQLCLRRKAFVYTTTSKQKVQQVRDLGATRVFTRDDDLLQILGKELVDVIIDNVAGANFGSNMELLKRGGKYATSGAIAGPMVNLDFRTLYLKDITLIGCTAWDEAVFPNLISYIERDEIRPLISGTYPLQRIAEAQKEFLKKHHVGKIVLVPPKELIAEDPWEAATAHIKRLLVEEGFQGLTESSTLTVEHVKNFLEHAGHSVLTPSVTKDTVVQVWQYAFPSKVGEH